MQIMIMMVIKTYWSPGGVAFEGHPNSLLQNRGDGTFVDATRRANLYSRHPTQTAAWADFDRDGDLDLFIGNESYAAAGSHPSELYRNTGNGSLKSRPVG